MNMMEQIWKVRDSRGLTAYEKNFLNTIASRGEAGMFCEWKRNSDDMGIKKDSYYKTRNSLRDKGLISVTEQPYAPTVYKIIDSALIEWAEAHSATQNDVLPDRNRDSATQNGHSVRPERKKNIKKNKEEELSEEHDSSVVPPSSYSLKDNKNNKDDVDPAILIGDNPPADPMVGNDTRHSVTQNEKAPWEIEYETTQARLRAEGLAA